MATWKKIIVSGSNAELASVTASNGVKVGTNTIGTNDTNTFLSGSFSGSFFGDGSGLNGVSAAFPITQKTPIVGTDKVFINDGTSKYATVSQFTSASWAGITGDVLINGSGVAAIQPDSVALGTDTTGDYVTNVSASGALVSSQLSGEGSTPNITLNVSSQTFIDGVKTVLPSGTVSASVLTSPSQGTALLTTNGVAGTTADLGLETTDSPQFVGLTLTGDIAVNGGDITSTATTFNIGQTNVTTLNLGGSTTTSSFAGQVVVSGDLTVNGTTTTINTENLLVEDKFALFASGSDTNTDGGIIIQQGTSTGYALGVDASADRWALQNNIATTATSITPDAFMGVIQEGATSPSLDPKYGGSAGKGTLYIQTVGDSSGIDGDIWIYS
jgi:hypothetical protein